MKYTLSSEQTVEFNIYGNNCQILNSYLIKDKRSKVEFIEYLRSTYPNFQARTVNSYLCEWRVHNFLYKLNL